MGNRKISAFTLIELLVVIAIIATIAAFAVPALTSALTKGQMTGTMNNARQLYLAGYQMSLDGSTNGDATRQWPGDYDSAEVATVTTYVQKLVQNGYLKGGDLQKLLSAPGAACTVSGDFNADPPTITGITPKSALKIYRLKESDASNAIFAVTANYEYNKPITATGTPYGDKGFIAIRKGGDAIMLRKNNASQADYGGDLQKFQAAVGVLPTGAATEGSTVVLANP
jgi:prepilin-type N-terminal cleavage/methylation domain-containing protein